MAESSTTLSGDGNNLCTSGKQLLLNDSSEMERDVNVHDAACGTAVNYVASTFTNVKSKCVILIVAGMNEHARSLCRGSRLGALTESFCLGLKTNLCKIEM